jgi:hypothetical protein
MYLDKSNKNNNITTIVVKTNKLQNKYSRNIDVALINYKELKKLIIKVEQLIKLCKAKIN